MALDPMTIDSKLAVPRWLALFYYICLLLRQSTCWPLLGGWKAWIRMAKRLRSGAN